MQPSAAAVRHGVGVVARAVLAAVLAQAPARAGAGARVGVMVVRTRRVLASPLWAQLPPLSFGSRLAVVL